MTNECDSRGEFLTMPVPLAANGGIGPLSGDPLMFGLANSPSAAIAAVASTSETPPGSLVPTGNIGIKLVGVFFFSVIAGDGTPGTSKAINPGDRVYAFGGAIDVTTGCLYGFSLNTNSNVGWYYGNSLDAIPAGQTATIRVRLKVGG